MRVEARGRHNPAAAQRAVETGVGGCWRRTLPLVSLVNEGQASISGRNHVGSVKAVIRGLAAKPSGGRRSAGAGGVELGGGGQDRPRAGSCRGDKVPVHSGRSCGRAAAPHGPPPGATRVSLARVGTIPALLGPTPRRPPQPHVSPLPPPAPRDARRRSPGVTPGCHTGGPAGAGQCPAGGGGAWAEGSLSRSPASTACPGGRASPHA